MEEEKTEVLESFSLQIGGKAYKVFSAPHAPSISREAIDVTGLSDSVKQFVSSPLTEMGEMTFSVGARVTQIDDTATEITLTQELRKDGAEAATKSTMVITGTITSIEPDEVNTTARSIVSKIVFKPSGASPVVTPSVV